MMAKSVEFFRQRLIDNREMQARAERENEEKAKRAKRIEEMTEEFDRASTQMVSSVAEGATELKSVASSMSGIANRTAEKRVTVAAAARTEERRVGKECVSKYRARGSQKQY